MRLPFSHAEPEAEVVERHVVHVRLNGVLVCQLRIEGTVEIDPFNFDPIPARPGRMRIEFTDAEFLILPGVPT